MKLSIVIPVLNEAECITETVRSVSQTLSGHGIDHEIIVVNDHSTDQTAEVLKKLSANIPGLIICNNPFPRGYGYAVRYGLEKFSGDCVAVMMGDLSDSPSDLVSFFYKLNEGYDCVFGSRWIKGGKASGYPFIKKMLNRFANNLVRILFRIRYNDCTNAFKMYRRETIEGLKPFLSPHFNLTLEMPLKSIVRGYSYAVLPNTWQNRKHGISKLRIREMGSRYFFILLYCLIEKYFSGGDFKKPS